MASFSGALLLASCNPQAKDKQSETPPPAQKVQSKGWIDIDTVYRSTEGLPFAFVVLDVRAGIRRASGFYQVAGPSQSTDQIPADTFAEIEAACKTGERELASGTPESADKAFGYFSSALELLPEPRERWNAAGWILSRMGECYFRAKSYSRATTLYADLMYCPGALGNPWVHLRKGQVHFETGQLDRAADDLMRAYMGGGKAIFGHEDPKYYEFLRTRADGLEP